MKILKDKVVTIHFTVMDCDKDIIDSTQEQEPLAFIHGSGLLLEALENEMTGRQAKEKFELKLTAAEAYGDRQEVLVQAMPISMFKDMEVEPGMQFRATTDDGEHSVIVVEVTEDNIVVDGNHPLAGIDLTFDVQIIDVRDASEEELAHGHIHAPGHSCDGETHH